jgi:hypothetical protein
MLAELSDVSLTGSLTGPTGATGATGPTGPVDGAALVYDAQSGLWRDGVAVGGGQDEIWVSATEPAADSTAELWIDMSGDLP